MSDVLALPFDQYQRYRLVADLLRSVRGKGAELSVLDVGGRTAVLREFLPDARITLVDMEASSEPGLVLGDGSQLPFADDAFDVVAAFDTLEHVPPPRRKAFVAECARVAKRLAVLCGPYEAPRVVEGEQLLQRFLKDKLGVEHRYLDEHRHHGLPDRARVEAQLREAGAVVASIGHANLDRWLVLQCLSMFMDYDPALRPLAAAFQRYYNRSLYASDHAEPVYRHAVIAAFDGTAVPSASDLLGPARAPDGALPPFFELAGELVAFDREREAWHVERGALRKMADELRADLDGHKHVLEALRHELTAHQTQLGELHLHVAGHEASVLELQLAYDDACATQAALEQDLAGHRAALSEVQTALDVERRAGANVRELLTRERGEAERAREALERDLAGHKRSLGDMQANLAAHQKSLAELNQDLDGHRRALADRVQRQRELETDLGAHKAALSAVQADLEGHARALAETRAELASSRAQTQQAQQALARSDDQLRSSLTLAAGLEQSLAQREEVYDKLQTELRSRWRNLMRVFRIR